MGDVCRFVKPTGEFTVKKLLPVLALALCAVLMVAASAPKPNAQLGTASIAGLVTDSVTGLPIVGAKVTAGCCGSYFALTGSDGRYIIENLPAGDYPVKAMKCGEYTMKTYPTPVHVDEGQAVTGIDFALAPVGGGGGSGTISGTVLDARSGAPIAGVKVMAGCCHGGSALTAEDGTYTISGLADGSYTVKAMKTGYNCGTYPTPVVITNGLPVTGIDFHLTPRVFAVN
jgi:hypothetical protein